MLVELGCNLHEDVDLWAIQVVLGGIQVALGGIQVVLGAPNNTLLNLNSI